MKHINLFIAFFWLGIFAWDMGHKPNSLTWLWFIVGLANLAEWLRYSITSEIKEYIDNKINP